MDNQQSSFNWLRELALFAGAGGGILGGHLLGWRTVCAVEWEPYPAAVLAARQNEGILPPFPIWDDVQTFEGKSWRGLVDVVSGGFPCQDISAAGRGAGITGARSGMWKHMARIICEVGPRYVFVENSPMLTHRGINVVLGDLAEMGYDAEWGVLGASDCGAPHIRKRIWILGYAKSLGLQGCSIKAKNPEQRASSTSGTGVLADTRHLSGRDWSESGETELSAPTRLCDDVAHPASVGQSGSRPHWYAFDPAETREGETDMSWAERVGHIWGVESPVGRVANGVPDRMDRLKALGNAQVPIVAATAFRILHARLASR